MLGRYTKLKMINGQTHFGGYRRQRKNRHVSGGSLCRRSNQVGGTWGTNTNAGPTDVDGSKWVPGGATGVGINVRLRSVNTMSGSWRITDTPTLANEIINFVMEQHGERKSYPARRREIIGQKQKKRVRPQEADLTE
ncbi:hypothetical protein RUM44_006745 [Polyplax serrata]|uniref:Uncharacterized protein n=1 Tax=Polyplax serrata TaxID=468196 RepID=A0ABR1AJ10_POLSC